MEFVLAETRGRLELNRLITSEMAFLAVVVEEDCDIDLVDMDDVLLVEIGGGPGGGTAARHD